MVAFIPFGMLSSFVVASLFYSLCIFLAGSFGLFISFVLYLHYLHKIHDHLPGPPRSSFMFGHAREMRKYQEAGGLMMEYFLEKRLEYGPIYLIFLFHRPVVIIGDPVYVKQVFIDSQKHFEKDKFLADKFGFPYGERGAGYGILSNTDKVSWHKRRLLMNPAFHRNRLKSFMTDFNQVCDRFLERMKNVVDQKQEANMVEEFGRVTLDVISQVSFNTSVRAIEDPDCPFSKAIASSLRGVQANWNIPLNSFCLSIFKFRLFQSATQKEQIEAVKFLRKFAFECITNRIRDIEADRDVPDDLLNMLVNDKTLTMDDIMDEFVTMFVAGQETTANSMAFALYEITQHPEIEAKILKEIEDVLGSKEQVEFEDLGKLKYLGRVMQESLRKYPVAGTGPFRKVVKEVIVGGYKIPEGDAVIASKYVFNHNPEFWENPDVFDPERFSEPEKIHNFSTLYFPFSVGPRNCIGQTLSKFEFKVLLARLLKSFRFELLPEQTGAMEERVTIAPRDGVVCHVMAR